MHPFLIIMHAIGAPDATASFELQVNPEGPEINPEVEVQQAGLEEPEEEIECTNHEPASFMKGKPRSILSPPFIFERLLDYVIPIDALSIGVVMKPLLHLIHSLSRYLTTTWL